MPKVIYYVAASLDGHIADADGKVDWLHQYEDPKNDYGYKEFYECLDAVIMGSKTYMDIFDLSDEWVYPGVETVVLTRQSGLPVFEGAENLRFAQGEIKPIIDEMKTRLVKDIWLVGGADLAAQMLEAGVLDELQLTTMPLLLGGGTPMLPKLAKRYPLRKTAHKVYDNGVIQVTYAVQQS